MEFGSSHEKRWPRVVAAGMRLGRAAGSAVVIRLFDLAASRLDAAESVDLARQLLSEREDDLNLRFLERAIERFPDDPELRLLYGTALIPFRPEEVPVEVAAAISLDPNAPTRVFRAASILFHLGHIEAARSYVAQVERLAPEGFLFEQDLADLKTKLVLAPPADADD